MALACAARQQASQRPPRVDHVEVDVGAVAGDDVVEVLLVSEREGGEVVQGIPLARLGPVDDAGDFVAVEEDVRDLQVAMRERRSPRPERGLGDPAVAGDQVSGQDAVRHEPLALVVEFRRQRDDAPPGPTGPGRQGRLVQLPDGGARRGPRRRPGRRPAEAPQRRPGERGDREHGRLAPQNLRGRDRREGHRLDLGVDARLIGVHLQEHVTDAQSRTLGMGDDDFDLIHGRPVSRG